MSTDDHRPQDGTQPQDGAGDPAPEQPTSVLGGFSWDDPGASPDTARTGSPDAVDAAGVTGATPAAYPPPAPYPPAGAPTAPPSEQPRVTLDKPSAAPAGATPDPYAAPSGPGYGQPVAPEQGPAQPYGQQVPYGQGYGQSASYTTTPQPYAYGPPPLSPEAEKVRSSAILWTVLNGVAIFLCGNLLSIGGVILAALAIQRVRENVPSARNLVKWSWILFAVGFAFWLLIIIGYVVFFLVLGTASMSGGF